MHSTNPRRARGGAPAVCLPATRLTEAMLREDEEKRIARKIATLEEQVAACGAKLTACDDQLAAGESERAQLRSLLEMTTAAQEHSLAEAARQLEPVQRRLAETIALKVAQEAECARLR